MNTQIQVFDFTQLAQRIEPTASTRLQMQMHGIGHRLEFADHESGNHHGRPQKTRFADPGDATIDERAHIHYDYRNFNIVRNETYVGDHQVELILTA